MGQLYKKIGKWLKNIIRKKNNSNDSTLKSIIGNTNLINAKARVQYSEIKGNVIVGEQSIIYKAIIEGDIQIGRYTTINGPGTELVAGINPIFIGSFCSIASNTVIREHNHNIKSATTYFIKKRIFKKGNFADAVSKGPITIGNDVWIGTQSVILTGVNIGDGAVIAAKSLVNKNVPPYAIVGGIPAKILSYRFDGELIKEMLKVEWWNWGLKKIEANEEFFSGELTIDKIKNIKE